jgi:hypothetical protein
MFHLVKTFTDHQHVQVSPPMVPILSQINSVDIVTHYFSKIHFNIISTYALVV